MGLYGKEFKSGGPVLISIVFVAVLYAAGTVVGQMMVSTGKMWFGVSLNMLWGLILIGLTALLAPSYGARGLGLAYLVAYALHTIVQLVYFWRHLSKMTRIASSSLVSDDSPSALLQDPPQTLGGV
jgi:O-antigen/teichoic acid export membrane protein